MAATFAVVLARTSRGWVGRELDMAEYADLDALADQMRDVGDGGTSVFMLEEARRASEHGDVPVGAVVVDSAGRVIGSGHNERELTQDPSAHAELLALRRAATALGSWRLSGCTLVVTLEPCTMCAGAAVLARVDRVVYGAVDEKAGAVGSLWDVVRDRRLNHRPVVVSGLLAEESAVLLRDFFRIQRVVAGPP